MTPQPKLNYATYWKMKPDTLRLLQLQDTWAALETELAKLSLEEMREILDDLHVRAARRRLEVPGNITDKIG